MREYSLAEVATHNTAEDCWLIVSQRVYQVTEYLPKHPGSAQAIIRKAGTDVTRDFYFHSPAAHKLWKKYQIGVVTGYRGSNDCQIL